MHHRRAVRSRIPLCALAWNSPSVLCPASAGDSPAGGPMRDPCAIPPIDALLSAVSPGSAHIASRARDAAEALSPQRLKRGSASTLRAGRSASLPRSGQCGCSCLTSAGGDAPPAPNGSGALRLGLCTPGITRTCVSPGLPQRGRPGLRFTPDRAGQAATTSTASAGALMVTRPVGTPATDVTETELSMGRTGTGT